MGFSEVQTKLLEILKLPKYTASFELIADAHMLPSIKVRYYPVDTTGKVWPNGTVEYSCDWPFVFPPDSGA